MALPSVAMPNMALHPRTVQDVKRMRPGTAFASSTDAISSAVRPPSDHSGIAGVGDHPTAGRHTNPSRPWNFKAIPFNNKPWTEELLEDSLVFIYRANNEIIQTRDDVNRVVVLGLPQLHRQIHRSALEEPGKWGPEQVYAKWMLGGVLTSHPPLDGAYGSERGIVITSMGDVRTVNYWGNNVRGSDSYCWLVLREEEVTSSTAYNTANNGAGLETPGTRCSDGTTLNYVTRFVPVISDSPTHVALSDLVYCKGAEECTGIPIYVGHCVRNLKFNPAQARDVRIDAGPTLDMDKQGRVGRIEMQVAMSI